MIGAYQIAVSSSILIDAGMRIRQGAHDDASELTSIIDAKLPPVIPMASIVPSSCAKFPDMTDTIRKPGFTVYPPCVVQVNDVEIAWT
ncbi:hypothetical protein BUE93_03430 [Chromobacterium amazonense]|uniref:Uncharacterized protein n=1 Tax=Chromobacterium amazonense TaxID=1382803 RepID=A0A2S9X8B6_9NEIS|nr:hypothetical protein BUE93_03430 [Chromobacterium amazonense]